MNGDGFGRADHDRDEFGHASWLPTPNSGKGAGGPGSVRMTRSGHSLRDKPHTSSVKIECTIVPSQKGAGDSVTVTGFGMLSDA